MKKLEDVLAKKALKAREKEASSMATAGVSALSVTENTTVSEDTTTSSGSPT